METLNTHKDNIDPNQVFLLKQRNEFRKKSIFIFLIPAGLITLIAGILNIINVAPPKYSLAIPELVTGVYFLSLAYFYKVKGYNQIKGIALLIPLMFFWYFLFASQEVHHSIIILLPTSALVCFILFERKLAIGLSLFIIVLGAVAYLNAQELNSSETNLHWLNGPASYNILFSTVFMIVTLFLHTGIQENIENKLLLLASHDGLTGLGNRQYFANRADEEISTVFRTKLPLSIIIIDIDFFKKVNDTYGHQCGDRVLKSLANTLNNTVRKSETCFRIGGEEFAVLIPQLAEHEVYGIAERIRENIEQSTLVCQSNDIKITASLGIASTEKVEASLNSLYEAADSALYQAKSSGRNRTVLYVNKAPAS